MKLAILVAGALAAIAPVAAANAAVVIASSVVTGGPGAYTHTFTLTNNIAANNTLYFFGVDLAGTIIGTPASWAGAGNQNANWSNAGFGGSAVVYPNTWCCSFGATPTGTSTTGFAVLSAVNPATVRFFSFGSGDAVPANDGHFSNSNNPGYEGIVNAATTGVPEPTSWAMMLTGFGLVGIAARRRKAVATA